MVFASQDANPIIYNAKNADHTGTYTVTVTDGNGCSATASVSVTVNPVPTINSHTITNASCGASTGAISITQAGGASFLWSNGATTQNISGLSSGNYTVVVTNASGCSVRETYAVQNSDGPVATVSSKTNVSCSGGTNGAIDLNVTGGTPGYTYAWDWSREL